MTPANSSKEATRFWYLLLFSLFLLLYLSELLEASMFIDGVWYAVISNNLSEGVGSFWQPQFSSTIFSAFHEHPPFIFGLQAMFFKLFGDHFLTERFFSLLQYGLLIWLIIALWKKVVPAGSNYRYLWFIPLIFWQANLVSYYFLPANLLDTPLAILSALSIYLMLKSTTENRTTLLLWLAGIVLGFSVLTKGVVGLFPLGFIGIHYLLFKPYGFSIALKRTIWVVFSFLSFLALLFLLVPAAWENINQYLEVQLLASLKGERRLYYFQTNRFYIVGQLLWTLLPMFFALVVISLLYYLLKLKNSTDNWINLPPPSTDASPSGEPVESISNNKHALLFLITGLSASLPIMISPRQALPYLIPSLPYFSLAFGIWVAPKVHAVFYHLINSYRVFLRLIELGALSLCCLGFCLVIYKYGQPNKRDLGVIEDAKTIGKLVGKNKTIASTTYNMYISGYLMRYDKISLDTIDRSATYLITKKEEPYLLADYEKVAIPTYEYLIYKKTKH